MARTSAVEYERVVEACSSLFLEGKSPSFESVYELIGRKGGAKVVQGMIADWRKEMANRFMAGRTNPDLPEELITEADKVLTVVWRLALEKSDAAYADERSRLDQSRVDTAAAVTQAQERAAEFEHEALVLQGELQTLQVRLQGSQTEIKDLRQRLADTTTLLRARDEQIGQMREDGARLANTLESERRNHETELLAERERHDQAVNAERQRAHESVEREREIAAGERQYLMHQTDETRQAAKANEAAFKEQLQEVKAFAESFQARAGRAEGEAAFWRGKAEAAAEESSRWQRSSEDAAGKIESLQGRIRILEHELAQRAPEGSPKEKSEN
ncbi:MAG: DNA-binding protein [Accumulibacter sp.]|uniref:DNA-binding protein n=1 Tax=Accumulibacter sp. TaxID=2053492 RepID=UPI002FC3ACEB